MAKNEDIIADITALAAEKGVDVPVTEGLNNAQLAATLKTMKAPAAPAPAPAPAKPAAPAPAKPADNTDDIVEPVNIKRPPFYIKDGKSLTTLKGILGPGDEVKVEYLIDGKDGLKRHVANGVIAKA